MNVPIRFPAIPIVCLLLVGAALLAACSSGGDTSSVEDDQSTVIAAPAADLAVASEPPSDGATPDESSELSLDETDRGPAPTDNTGEEIETPPEATVDIDSDPEALPQGIEDPSTEVEPAPDLQDTLALRFPEHEGFATSPIWNRDGRPLFGAVSTGLIPFPAPHVFAIYEAVPDGFIELAVLEINPDVFSWLFEDSVQQLLLREGDEVVGSVWGNDLWFEVYGAVGAHGSAFALIRFDGTTLDTALLAGSATPFPGEVIDLDADGVPEVLLNRTNAYVFCYACAVQEVGFEIVRWDGADLVMVNLDSLPDDADEASQEAVDFAITLANADLWRDAVVAIELAERLEPENDVVKWNAIFIRLMAEARLEVAEDAANTTYPFLSLIFAGEHEEAVRFLAGFDAFDLIDLFGPVTAGTTAEGWEDQVALHVVDYTDRALTVLPDLAPALFLRGLAQFWLSPDQAEQSITDINAAAALAPDEPLFEMVANLLTP